MKNQDAENRDQFMGAIVDTGPMTRGLHAAHVATYAELIPHVFMGELTDQILDVFGKYESDLNPERAESLRVLSVLEDGVDSADAWVRDLVTVSFLENLEPASPGYRALLRELGPKLRKRLDVVSE